MTAATKEKTGPDEAKLKQLRAAFKKETIGLLPKTTCRDCANSRSRACERHSKKLCDDCRNFITTAHIHLDYVGHAAVTDRLLTVDPNWSWEPMALSDSGVPMGDSSGNLWIKLTVLGVTRPGVGDGANMKEKIGDAIRNAAMRFGVALDLWSKEELESVIEDESLKNAKPSDDIRSSAEIEAEAEEQRLMTELGDQLWDLLKSRYAAKRIRMTVEALKTSDERRKAIATLTRADQQAEDDAPIDLAAEGQEAGELEDGIDLSAESTRFTEDEPGDSELDELKRAIFKEMNEQGITSPVKQKTRVVEVLGQSDIATVEQAAEVYAALKQNREPNREADN